MRCATWYPPARPRWPGGAPAISEKYEREQSSGQVTAGDADATLITFSGRPDSIVLTTHENGAIFTLSDRLGRDAVQILLGADAAHETHFAAELVLVRNHTAGSNAHVCAVGKWAERAPDSRGD